ncbi:SIR2 family protein [Limosilactobacillus reuteri]|uniref:SIR2 family protein n=1 Tax=Limosilactobacillus reuteri TaxID=1598 RepID=UPI001E4127B4|nr:SIR2 family protein [Limosilactobacillus reuteri]MCC4347425.1 SIR2 family protein [Limosilactobacillus reuteri]MCC4375186.1 SIR2 family protein [Limosilactobacillus reuteri]MCC4384651.1 SIR2 family protein [Limosilactobacillus reuteri]
MIAFLLIRDIQKSITNGFLFFSNLILQTTIKNKFDELFFDEKVNVDGLSIKDAQKNRISPFKWDLANRFKKIDLKESIDLDELSLYEQLLKKSRIIVTTNYDSFIENILIQKFNQNPTIYVGNKGFFDNTNGWSEIYKIHGSTTDPKSIVITKEDYDEYDKNSVLISAKILSSMIDSPIIFLGYSLQDRNIRNLLSDFSKQLPAEDPRKSANRIFVINRKENEKALDERIYTLEDSNITCTLIDTDNYKELFKKLLKINEGATPYEVKKYQRLIRKLIISSGQKGSLHSVMISPDNLDTLENKIDQNDPVVMALGEAKYFYVYPDLLSYIEDYFNNTNKYAPEVALAFAAREGNSRTRIPFSKYWHKIANLEEINLSESNKKKLLDKISYCGDLRSIKNSINSSYQIHFTSIEKISKQSGNSSIKKYELLSYNIDSLDLDELKNFIINQAIPDFKASITKGTNLKSSIRKFLLAYDFLINGNLK